LYLDFIIIAILVLVLMHDFCTIKSRTGKNRNFLSYFCIS
jgi:hypothetical protein